jgi:hypothetical protein
VAIEDALKAASIERRVQLAGKLQVIAAVGNEDSKLVLVGRVGELSPNLGDGRG